MRDRLFGGCVLAALAIGLVSCELDLTTEPDVEANESELVFLRFAPDAPPLADTVVSFWARRSEWRAVRIEYDLNGYGENGICLEFAVPAGSLEAGQAPGDSVQITIRVVDRTRFDFEFEPAGLRFEVSRPAELRVWYRWADPDLNADGVVDERDQALAERFGFWRQEQTGEPWTRIPTVRLTDVEIIHAPVLGFTRYAVASD